MTTNAGFTYTWDGLNAMTTLSGVSKNERVRPATAHERTTSQTANADQTVPESEVDRFEHFVAVGSRSA